MTGLLKRLVDRRSRSQDRFRQASAAEPAPAELRGDMVTSVVEAQDRIPEIGRVPDRYVHLSSLIGCCPRAEVLARDTGIELRNNVTGSQRIMWRIGRAVETHIRDSYINAVNYEGVHGKWRCDCHRTSYEGLFDPEAARCDHCGHRPRYYDELTVFDHAAGIGGNPDLVLMVDGKYLIIEIKSMKAESFDALDRPVFDHLLQAGGYRRIYENMGLPVHNEVVVIYVRKDFSPRVRPYKERLVNVAMDANVHRSLDLMWDMARSIRSSNLQNLPGRICNAPTDTRARNCPTVCDCFQRD